ncbi:MAG: hypothetical protein H0V17_25980 [Deltaproteobacteria bacterium]|nr:hypothetical protein [Deltaproteobacteria bacterium]
MARFVKRLPRMKTISRTLFLIGALTAAGACKSKTDDARAAQESANKKAVEATEAQREADEKAARAKREVDDRMVADHRDVEVKLRKDIDGFDRKMEDLRRKLADKKGDVRKNADAAANEVQLRHAKVDQNLTKLRTSAGNAWDATKLEVEADVAALKQAIDNLEDTLD